MSIKALILIYTFACIIFATTAAGRLTATFATAGARIGADAAAITATTVSYIRCTTD